MLSIRDYLILLIINKSHKNHYFILNISFISILTFFYLLSPLPLLYSLFFVLSLSLSRALWLLLVVSWLCFGGSWVWFGGWGHKTRWWCGSDLVGLGGLVVLSLWLDLVGLVNGGFGDVAKQGEAIVGSVDIFGEWALGEAAVLGAAGLKVPFHNRAWFLDLSFFGIDIWVYGIL